MPKVKKPADAKKVADVYATIDSLQRDDDHEELEQIAQYAIDALINDSVGFHLRLPTNHRKVE